MRRLLLTLCLTALLALSTLADGGMQTGPAYQPTPTPTPVEPAPETGTNGAPETGTELTDVTLALFFIVLDLF